MNGSNSTPRGRWTWSATARACVLVAAGALVLSAASADTVLTDFNAAAPGSYNPRAGWQGFGNGTTDCGIHAAGAAGNGAYHAVGWAGATWGIGEIATDVVDLTPYTAVAVSARVVDLGGLTGTAKLAFGLDLPGGTEFLTPAVVVTTAYQTYEFPFASLVRTAGSGALDLAAGRPKFIVQKNGQTGTARFDLDDVVGRGGGGGPYELSPVVLNRPWDGDFVRGMWLYAGTGHLRVDSAADSQAILDFCAHEGVNRIYFGAYSVWALGTPALKDNLRTFLRTAHASGLRVEALLDGTNWYANPGLVQSRLAEVLALHNATPTDAADDFDAVHFDVEFWLDAGWSGTEAHRQDVARQYFDNVLVNARAYLDTHGAAGVALAVDLSTHFDTSGMLPAPFEYGGVTQAFGQHVLDLVDDVVYMSYYDTVSALVSVTSAELDQAAGRARRIQLGADLQPVPPELPQNSFADNTPTPYGALTTVLQDFHVALPAARRAALDGFAVFHYDGYRAARPAVLSCADLNGDGAVTTADFALLAAYLLGPNVPAEGVTGDADYDGSGAVDLRDFAMFQACFSGGAGAVPAGCER